MEGLNRVIRDEGLTVSVAVFELANAIPVEVVPEIDNRYRVGVVTAIVVGMVKVTRLVVPVTSATAEAFVVTSGPPAVACRVTFVLAGSIVPLGKPEPVTMMFVTPACPAVGDVVVVKVTAVCACNRFRP